MSEEGAVGNRHSVGAALDRVRGILLHPFTVVMVMALAVRLVIMPVLTYNYDVSYWALIIRNIQAGNGLYEVSGYYYTPVWGYFLGAVGKVCGVLGVDTSVVRFDDLLVVEDTWWPYYVANLTGTAFNVMVKTPLVVCDFLVGYLVYWLVKDRTGDASKALAGMALWLFCPIVVYMSAGQGMFDTISVLFTLLTVILAYRGNYLLAGAAFSVAVLTKFFPIYIAFALIAYVIRKHRGDRAGMARFLGLAALGFIGMTLLIYAPVIAQSTVSESFLFFTDRLGRAMYSGTGEQAVPIMTLLTSMVFLVQPIIIGFVVYAAYRLYDSDNPDVDGGFLKVCMFSLALAFAWPSSPQYLLVLLPLLAYHVAVVDGGYLRPFLMIGFGAAFAGFFMCNFTMLLSFSKQTGLIGTETVLSIIGWMDATLAFGLPRMLFLVVAAGALQMAGIWLLLVKGFLEHRRGGTYAADAA
ncbi:MAG: glycosyltransferase family 39 protein [Thermoplasmatales archaeon]|nr:glycosyltransferase family 39 protein [Thermoplasmatales archaeon]